MDMELYRIGWSEMMHRTAGPGRLAILAALILSAAGAGCNSILDTTEDLAENANIHITGTSPVPLQLIVSPDFTAIENDQGRFDVTMNVSDTLVISPPYDHVQRIRDTGRVFVRLTQPDSTVTATLRMRVLLDREEVYNTEATMRNASLEYLFVYF